MGAHCRSTCSVKVPFVVWKSTSKAAGDVFVQHCDGASSGCAHGAVAVVTAARAAKMTEQLRIFECELVGRRGPEGLPVPVTEPAAPK
jgi:hypothetical protein